MQQNKNKKNYTKDLINPNLYSRYMKRMNSRIKKLMTIFLLRCDVASIHSKNPTMPFLK